MTDAQQNDLMFTKLSFSQLTKPLQDEVLACAKACHPNTPVIWPINPKAAFLNRLDLPQALERAQALIDDINPVTFPWIEQNKAQYYEEELSFAFYLALADCELAVLEERTDLEGRQDKLLHIGGLLAQLRNRTGRVAAHSGDYFGVHCITPKITQAMTKITVDNIANAVDYPASLNDGRLYLVWAAEMLTDMCLALQSARPKLSFELANAVLDYITYATGFMGWSLYFLRGGVNTAFLTEVSEEIQQLDLSEQEKQSYFWGKWDEKKFLVLNDAVWGLVNFLCFYILYGERMFAYAGDLLNGVLFVFDFSISLWELSETKEIFNALMDAYKQEAREIALARNTATSSADIARLQWRLNALNKHQKQVERAWDYNIEQLKLDAIYSGGVLFAVAMLCCFFIPPGILLPATASTLILIGSIMCFGFGIIHAGFSSRLQIVTATEALTRIQAEERACLETLRDPLIADDARRMLFLDKQQIDGKVAYQEHLLDYYHADMVCTFTTDMFFPGLFFAALIFMPGGMGLPVFAAGVVLMFAAKCYVATLAPDDVREASVPLSALSKCAGFFTPVLRTEPAIDAADDAAACLPPPFPEQEYHEMCRSLCPAP
ncbi:MAG: hypothetical protein K0U24_08495 [Gammaproteobacteria bacterium]|nr:hypothetical protein [Gammaproteobacteria bacterium]